PESIRPDYDELVVEPDDPVDVAPLAVAHAFAAGPRAGIALHSVFERIDFGRPVPPTLVADILGRHGISADAAAVADWLDAVLDTALQPDNGEPIDLRGLRSATLVRELEFT